MAGHDVQYGKHRTRRSFSRIKEVLDLPNLIEIQTDSFKDFLDHGLKEVFEDVLPISNFTETMELEFVGYEIKEPKYTLEEARIHDASYSAPIFVTFRLINKETGEMEPVFNLDKQEFTIYDLKDGRLILKDAYRTEENIRNWEEFKIDRVNLSNNSMFVAKSQAQLAVSSTQGNYEKLDTVLISKNPVTKSILLFKRWFANHAQQRFASGEGINPITGKKNMRGRYRHVIDNPSALLPATAIQTGISLGLGPISATVIGGTMAGLTLWSLYKSFKNKSNTKQRILNVGQMASFAKSVVINSINLPFEFVLDRKLLKREWDGFVPQGTLTPEQIGGIRATAKEIALNMNKQGADVIYHAAGGSGNGLFEAAAEAKTFALKTEDGKEFTLVVAADGATATLTDAEGKATELKNAETASGERYADEAGNEVAMKGTEGILTLGDLKEVPVTVEAK